MGSKVYIGIDPDLVKSGVAFWYKPEKKLTVYLLTFNQLTDVLRAIKMLQGLEVVIEAGWLNNKANFHKWTGSAAGAGERIAKNVGENHAVGKLLEQACVEMGIAYRLVKPVKSKVRAEYFTQLTGIKTKNQEMIDAGMLVYGI